MRTYEQFLNNYVIVNEKKGTCRIKSDFYRDYEGMTMPQAYEVYVSRVNESLSLKSRIQKFESFLRENNYQETQSNISESRYYHYNGIKVRFSTHIYPTGTMTQQYLDGRYSVIDLAADPELISVFNF